VGGLVWWQNNSKIADGHHFEIYRHISAKNHPIVIKYYTAADFELGERHVIKKMKNLHWTDSDFDSMYFFFCKQQSK